ncbi:MAG TPA: hypothetical protein VGC15_03895 [Acetobacteraceae bacterium]
MTGLLNIIIPQLKETAMNRIFALLLLSSMVACADVRPDPVVSPQLDSGVTSSNGGGTRALGNQPGVGVTTRVGPR